MYRIGIGKRTILKKKIDYYPDRIHRHLDCLCGHHRVGAEVHRLTSNHLWCGLRHHLHLGGLMNKKYVKLLQS